MNQIKTINNLFIANIYNIKKNNNQQNKYNDNELESLNLVKSK